MRVGALAAGLLFAAGAFAGSAHADCTCRAPGFVAHHGETVCLKTAAGPRLARCEMSLNNASWTFLPEPCPEASLKDRPALAANMSPAPLLDWLCVKS